MKNLKGGRVLTLVGSILGTVASVITTIIMFLAVLTLAPYIGGNTVLVLSLVLLIVLLAISIVALIMDIRAILASKSDESLRNKKVGVIVAIVFNFVVAAYLLYTLMVAAFSAIIFVSALLFVAASVLMIVDLAKLKNAPATPVEAPAENSENV